MNRDNEELDWREASKLLGISQQRWRQLTAEHVEFLGGGLKVPGKRGATWPRRRILELAAVRNRPLAEPLPPYLPAPDGPRYVPVSQSNVGASDGRTLAAKTDRYIAEPVAYGQLFTPARPVRCDHEEAPVLVLTPLWPTTANLVGLTLPLLVGAAAEGAWASVLGSGGRAAAAGLHVLVVQDGHRQHHNWPYSMYVSAGELATAVAGQARPVQGLDWEPVNAVDAAQVLGWSAWPLWPEGTNTATNVALWRPGQPVPGTIPADLAEQAMVASWLMQEAARRTDDDDARNNILALAAGEMIPIAMREREAADYGIRGPADLPAGFEYAATVHLPQFHPEAPGGDIYAGMSWAAEAFEIPIPIGDQMLVYFGDTDYSAPMTVNLAVLPDPWPALFAETARTTAEHSEQLIGARRRRFESVVGEQTIELGLPDAGSVCRLAPSDAPMCVLAVGEDPAAGTVVWCPPTGMADGPARMIPSPDPLIVEVLLVRELRHHKVAGWVRNAGGVIFPLPCQPPGLPGDDASAVVASIVGCSTREAKERWWFTVDGERSTTASLLDRLWASVQINEPRVWGWADLVNTIVGDVGDGV